MADTETSFIESARKRGPRLRFALQHCDEHIVSAVQLECQQAWIDLLHSPPWVADAPWPATPPWQELHIHESGSDPRVFLLVGRAGSSHWSMTVSCDEEQSIVFDVACRLRAKPEFLGTTYQLAAPAKIVAGAAVLDVALLDTIVVVEPLAIDDAPSATVALEADELVVRPIAERPAPATIRWKYRIRAGE